MGSSSRKGHGYPCEVNATWLFSTAEGYLYVTNRPFPHDGQRTINVSLIAVSLLLFVAVKTVYANIPETYHNE